MCRYNSFDKKTSLSSEAIAACCALCRPASWVRSRDPPPSPILSPSHRSHLAPRRCRGQHWRSYAFHAPGWAFSSKGANGGCRCVHGHHVRRWVGCSLAVSFVTPVPCLRATAMTVGRRKATRRHPMCRMKRLYR